MDTSTQVTELIAVEGPTGSKPKRQYRTTEEKQQIVEETLAEGASVARIARARGINANQVFGWRKLYLGGRMGGGTSRAIKLLPVQVSESSPPLATTSSQECSGSVDFAKSRPGTIHIELRHAQVRIEGSADPGLLRVLLECLRR
jgi:transposase